MNRYKDSVVRLEHQGNSQEQNTTSEVRYTVMGIVPGKCLVDYFEEITTLKDDIKLKIMLNILEAVKYMHSKGIVAHNDLGPQNIMVDEDIGAEIIDFGSAVYEDYPYAFYADIDINSFHYIAPESRADAIPQKITTGIRDPHGGMANYITSAADVFSLGFQFFNYGWLDYFSNDRQIDLLEDLLNKMCQKIPENRPTIDECINKLKAILILNFLENDNTTHVQELLASSLMCLYSDIKLFEECLNKNLVDLKKHDIGEIIEQFFKHEIPIDQIIAFIKNHQSQIHDVVKKEGLHYNLVKAIKSDDITKARKIALELLYLYDNILKIKKLLSDQAIPFDFNFISSSEPLNLYEIIANKISASNDLNKINILLNEISMIDENILKNILTKIHMPANLSMMEIAEGNKDIANLIYLMNILEENDKLSFLIDQENLKFIKSCISQNPTVLLNIARIILKEENWKIFISNFSLEEIKSYIKNFNDFGLFRDFYSILAGTPELQKKLIESFDEQIILKLISDSFSFIEAVKLFSEPQRSIVIEKSNLDKIFEIKEDVLSLMHELSREEFTEILKNQKFLQTITRKTQDLSSFFADEYMDCIYDDNSRTKLLSQFLDMLLIQERFNITTLTDNISILSESQKYDFLLQPDMQRLLKDSIHSIFDLMKVLEIIPSQTQRSNFLNQLNMKQSFVTDLFNNSDVDHQKQLLEYLGVTDLNIIQPRNASRLYQLESKFRHQSPKTTETPEQRKHRETTARIKPPKKENPESIKDRKLPSEFPYRGGRLNK